MKKIIFAIMLYSASCVADDDHHNDHHDDHYEMPEASTYIGSFFVISVVGYAYFANRSKKK